jgi:hypothetical protein
MRGGSFTSGCDASIAWFAAAATLPLQTTSALSIALVRHDTEPESIGLCHENPRHTKRQLWRQMFSGFAHARAGATSLSQPGQFAAQCRPRSPGANSLGILGAIGMNDLPEPSRRKAGLLQCTLGFRLDGPANPLREIYSENCCPPAPMITNDS